MRAYQKLKRGNGEKQIFEIFDKIFSNFVLKSKKISIEECIENKNYNLSKSIYQKLIDQNLISLSKSFMLSSAGSEKYHLIPLPISWQIFLRKIGVRINFLSSIYFLKNLYILFIVGLKNIFKLIFYIKESDIFESKYILLMSFPEKSVKKNNLENFLFFLRNTYSAKIITFGNYQSKVGSDLNLKQFPFPSLNWKLKLFFFVNCVSLTLKSLVYLFLGNWRYLFLFNDLVFLNYLRLISKNKLPEEIIFTQSDFIYRPLWSYKVKKTSLFFYSANTLNYKFSNGQTIGVYPGYKSMSWDQYYTYSKSQKIFLQRLGKNQIIFKAEGIPFIDSNTKIQLPSGFKVGFFDILTFRDSYLAHIGRPVKIYNLDYTINIYNDILEWCESNSSNLVVKAKRKVGEKVSKRYLNQINFFKTKKNVSFINEDTAPTKIIKKLDCVICQPFSSPAIFASQLKKSVIYYDPSHYYKPNQLASHGITLIQGKNKLFEWLSTQHKIYKGNND